MSVRKICIVSPDDYAILSGDPSFGPIGGEAVQHLLLARAWRDLGLDVSIIVRVPGKPRFTEVDGIRVVATPSASLNVPGVRFVQKIRDIVRAMKQVDADVYYQSPSGVLTGVVAWFAKRHAKCAIVRIASDLSCIPGKQLIGSRVERAVYEYGLRHASLIASQTQHQRELLQRHYGLDSVVVNMLVEVPKLEAQPERDIDVLWVGNPRPVKRPELLFELARRLPRFNFTMVGAPLPHQHEYYDRISAEARALSNVSMLGSVRYTDVGTLFERAKIHVNTSSIEGFPNTFLQAWVRRVPVVSFFDPDDLIERRDLGRRCSDLDEMAEAIDGLLSNPARRHDIGNRARAFVAREFSTQGIAASYLRLAEAAIANGAGSASEMALRDRRS